MTGYPEMMGMTGGTNESDVHIWRRTRLAAVANPLHLVYSALFAQYILTFTPSLPAYTKESRYKSH